MSDKQTSAGGDSRTNWPQAMFAYPATPDFGESGSFATTNWLSRQYAQGMVSSLGLMETWLENTRHFSDMWRSAIRQQQDVMLDNMETQFQSMLGLTPKKSRRERPEPSPASQKRTRETTSRAHEEA